jgi:2-keto-4-pentenoate hydratase/2-oxohepta-3-ene-1,7-dioic acid hydratase in catechol pathway
MPSPFVTLRHAGAVRVGMAFDDTIRLLPPQVDDLVGLIAAGPAALQEARRQCASPGAQTARLSGAALLAPIRRFRRDVLCTGWNYWDHFEEGVGKRDGQEVPRPVAPTFFTKGPDSVIGPYDPIAYDARISAKWDYETELVVVIGKQGRSIPAGRAMEHVWGYCLANDISQRDLQRRHGGQWLKGKSIDGTTPLGPWVVPADEIDPASVRLKCVVNGVTLQDASVAQMAFPIPELIAELSFGMTLMPGDILLTGTPSGVGHARTPPLFLKVGDEVVTVGEGIGELRNRLVETDLFGDSSVRLAATG